MSDHHRNVHAVKTATALYNHLHDQSLVPSRISWQHLVQECATQGSNQDFGEVLVSASLNIPMHINH